MQVDAGKKSGKKVVAKREEVQVVSTGIDPDVVRRLQAELDLLKIKLASAERELGKMDGLKSEIERLKQQVSDKDKRIEELEEELKKLKAKKPPKAEVKEEVKKEVKPPPEKKEKKKEKKFKQDAPPTPKTPTQPTVAVKEEETPVEPVPVEEEPVEPPPEVSSEGSETESEESLPPKTFEDKCVGNGPGVQFFGMGVSRINTGYIYIYPRPLGA